MNSLYGHAAITLPVDFLAALATSDLRLAVYGLRALYGLTRYLHLLGMACFVGMVVLLDLRGLGLFPPAALDPARARLGLVLRLAFWLTVVTGLALFVYDPLGVGLHTMFLPKLVLVAAGYAQMLLLRRLPALRGRLQAGASLAIWLLVIGASTWNHVERPVQINAVLRAATVGK